jgi:hypothetical protein
MDDEVITWNLKGPKRMKKRRELNALIKNNYKYKSLQLRSAGHIPNSSSIDMYNMGNGSQVTNRLLHDTNNNGRLGDSSSDNEDFYFSGNKSHLKEI